ncbi:MAG: hypothetical protein ABFS32_08170 [Bacteroidota bacterium]
MAMPEIGKIVVCIVISGRKIIEAWQQNKDIESIIDIINNYENLLEDEQLKTEGKLTEKNTGSLILSTARNSMLGIWSQFCQEIHQDPATEQVDNLVGNLKTDIFNELDTVNGLNGKLPTKTLIDYHHRYHGAN